MDLIGKTIIGTQRFVCYIEVSAIEGCSLSGVSLYTCIIVVCTSSDRPLVVHVHVYMYTVVKFNNNAVMVCEVMRYVFT